MVSHLGMAAAISPVANSKHSYAHIDIQWNATTGDHADPRTRSCVASTPNTTPSS
jgi:hypothetical protein